AADTGRATRQDRNVQGGRMDSAGRRASGENGRRLRGETQLRGRTGYYESRRHGVRGRQVYEEYGRRGRGYGYAGGHRGYARNCPRYVYVNGRRVLNERCLGGYERGARHSYYGERGYSTRYGGRRGGAYVGQRTAVHEFGRTAGGKRTGMDVRSRTNAGQRA